MNYYSHNIGDYAQATMHLTLVEDAVYSRLLRRYYAEEQPIASDLVMVCRWVGARTSEEKEAVQVVLGEFFELEGGVYRNKRADLEIQAYHAKAETNRLNGKKGGRPSQKPKETQSVMSGLANGTQEEPSRNPNQEPVTKNLEPELPLAPKGEGDSLVLDAGVEQVNPMFDQFWAKYPNKTCKAKARAKWDKLNPDDALFAQIMAGLDRQCASAAWVKDGGQFVPHPTTWLNGERWNDEVRAAGNVHHLGSRHVGLNDQDYSRDLEANGDGTYRFNSILERTQRLAGIVGQEQSTCDRHGAYEAQVFRDERRSGCPACAEEAREKREAEEWAAQRRQGAVAKLERRLGSAMIPPRFTGKTFESYRAETAEQKKALASCRRYAEQFTENAQGGRCMLLLGKTGTGKTHLAAAVAQHVIREHGATAIYTTVSRICQHIKGSFGSDASYTEAQAIDLFAQADLLVIDEVGASRDNDFERMSIFEVVNKRYEEMKPTVLVSNLSASKFEASVGDRTADRLREGGGFVLLFEWESARRGAA